jgi:hypothetical protein
MDKKLGYYICDGKEFASKIHACLYAESVKKPLQWIFNNREFENNDWKTEPIETLDQLYDARARELREKYDYLILSYSGGADSHNILMSFIRQNLLIDEIVVNTMDQGNSKYTIVDKNVIDPKHAASEHYLQTIPRLKEVENLIPRTKINILDLTQNLFDSFTNVGDASWILNKREGLNPLGATRFNYIHFNEIRKKFDKQKKIALVLGIEKPRTFIHSNGKFYMRFTDRATNLVTVAEHIQDYTNSSVEYFYWSPDACRLLTKQAHIIKRWLEAFPEKQHLWIGKSLTAEKYRLVHERLLRNILYTTWNDAWYQADKATSDWYSEFDHWFIDGHKGSTAHNIWLEGIRYLENRAASFVKIDAAGVKDGLTVYSHNFEIGEMRGLCTN